MTWVLFVWILILSRGKSEIGWGCGCGKEEGVIITLGFDKLVE